MNQTQEGDDKVPSDDCDWWDAIYPSSDSQLQSSSEVKASKESRVSGSGKPAVAEEQEDEDQFVESKKPS